MKLIVTNRFSIIVGSHVHNLSGTGVVWLEVGDHIDAQDVASPECYNVWITTTNGTRGKIECGSWKNLIGDRCIIA